MSQAIKIQKRLRRHHRVRAKITGTAKQPRLCVFRSNQHIYAQLIDDAKGKTLVAANDVGLKLKVTVGHPESRAKRGAKDPGQKALTTRKTTTAFKVGQLLARKALKKGIKQVIFDRGGYKYHGRVKALAEGARGNGLKF